MAFRTIDGEAAWGTVSDAPHLRWSSDPAGFDGALHPVRHRPKFALTEADKVFCIGSCFARNVEEHLIYQGVRVLSRRIVSPASEFSARPNGVVNKFTTHSMVNEAAWLRDPPEIDASFFSEGKDSEWSDLQLTPAMRPVGLDRAIERRRYLISDYFARMREASVVIVTLGMIETWHDAASGLYLNTAPSLEAVRRHPGRFSLHVTDFGENLASLEAFCDHLGALAPDARVILTVSPVPLDVSFQGTDPAVANHLSKSVLRAVAEAVMLSRDNVDYFPSFEMVALARRSAAYAPDCRHVRDAVVRAVIGRFLELYMGRESDRAPSAFNELGYLAANPDVDVAVRAGELESGYEHWQTRGRSEGRPLLPAGGPTRKMVKSGAV